MPFNCYVYWTSLSIFHYIVYVSGVEYAFGAHNYLTSRVFEVKPQQFKGFKFRKSIFMGTNYLNLIKVREFMKHHSTN